MSCDISVLVVNWNTRELVLACLDALRAGVGDDVSIEAIVVDNGSADGSADVLALRKDIILIANEENRGFAEAVNQAYRRATGEFVLLLNSDVEVVPGAIRILLQFLRSRPEIAGAAPLYVNPDGSSQPFHFRLPSLSTYLVNGSSLVRLIHPGSERILRRYRMTDDDFSRPCRVEQPSASCLLLRTSYLPSDELLDESYPIFFNDVKLALTLAGHGLEMWVVPDSIVVHEAHSSARRLGDSAGRRQYLGSLVRLLSETHSAASVWAYRVIVFAQNTTLWMLQRRNVLHGRELLKALAGNPGPLPQYPSEHDLT